MDTPLIRSPVYQQLNTLLRSMLGREYALGSQFLTEREIVQQFSVSRPTANKALASLVSEGLLEFRKGVGTFVRANAMDYDLQSLVSFTSRARAAGKIASTQVLEFDKVNAKNIPAEIASALGVNGDQRLFRMVRLRFASGTPLIFEERFVVERHCPKLKKKHSEGSLYEYWKENLGLKILGADEVIHAVAIHGDAAKQLQISRGSPGFEVTAIGFLETREPLWREQTLYRGDLYEFRSRLGPIQSATPATGGLR